MNPKDSTTVIIRRRLRHWRTTAAGVTSLLAPVACILFPEYRERIIEAAIAILGGGLIAAPDSKNTDKTTVE